MAGAAAGAVGEARRHGPAPWLAHPRLVAPGRLLALGLLAWTAAQWTWRLLPPPASPAPPPAARAAAASAAPADPRALARRVAAWHLFGAAPAPAPAAPAADRPLPATSLRLTLRGVVAAEDPRLAAALVADASGRERAYRVGERLPGGAELVAVRPREVVLRRGGRLETLRLPRQALEGAAPAAPAAAAAAPRPAPDAAAVVRSYRERFLQNPQSVMDLVQGTPERRNGRLIGFRIRGVRDPEALRRLGLKPGDVVTAVNGRSLADPRQRMRLLEELTGAETLTVELLRDGTPYQLTIPVGPAP